ncbi:MAG TPA: L,D-transpeptidase [Candidatus Limnocylindrales bacterium]|nr:L,D-transpeptidase [Candidatus Limnocylindrales bacterium]
MRLAVVLLLAPFLAAAVIGTAQAEILITVDKSAQRMTVARDGEALYTWPVSTGRSGYATPSGSFTPFRMEADHYSKEWDDAPMPHSIFFTKIGHAIHGSYETKKLGTPASHGCVRLSPAHAATLFAMVKQDGVTNTKVVLTGSEQVALARRGSEARRDDETRRSTYVNPNADYPQPQYAPPDYRQRYYVQPGYDQSQYVNPAYGDVQPQYAQPNYGQPYYRRSYGN